MFEVLSRTLDHDLHSRPGEDLTSKDNVLAAEASEFPKNRFWC